MFDVPHRSVPWSANKICRRYPKFAALFDGKGVENTLSFYYKKDKTTDIYQFIDVDAEEEVAELMGVKILVKKELNEEDIPTESMNESQLQTFKEHMADIRTGLMWLKDIKQESSSFGDE